MAPLKQPPSLQKLSIENCVTFILKYCLPHHHSVHWKEFSQFVEKFIPPSFKSDVLHFALKKMALETLDFIKPETVELLLKLLLHPMIKELSFSDLIYAGETSYELLDSFENMLSNAIPYLPFLTYLDLSTHRSEASFPSCSYDVLFTVGRHCPNLRILDLNYNNRVTSYNLRCLGPSPDGPGCQKLEEVYVQDCSLTPSDIIWLLQTFNNLRNIGYPDMGTILHRIKVLSRRKRCHLPQLKLTHIDNSESTRHSSDRDVIRLVEEMCPLIDNLKVRICDEDASELYYLKSITKLELRYYTGIHHRIGAESMAYLHSQGCHLVSLTIFCSRLESFHVATVASACLNLKQFFLHANSFEENGDFLLTIPNRMDHLKVLSIRIGQHEMDDSPMSGVLASYLISPCHMLQEMYLLVRCTEVNYDFLSSCLQSNPLMYLKIFICDAPRRNQGLPMVHLGYSAALLMIESCVKLDTLGNLIAWCVTADEVEELERIIRVRNLDVNLIHQLSNKINKKYF